jgi:hypothetical protein
MLQIDSEYMRLATGSNRAKAKTGAFRPSQPPHEKLSTANDANHAKNTGKHFEWFVCFAVSSPFPNPNLYR